MVERVGAYPKLSRGESRNPPLDFRLAVGVDRPATARLETRSPHLLLRLHAAAHGLVRAEKVLPERAEESAAAETMLVLPLICGLFQVLFGLLLILAG